MVSGLSRALCFVCCRYGPENCHVTECSYVMTYRVVGEDAHFEMSTNEEWVALGFSSDNLMVCYNTKAYTRKGCRLVLVLPIHNVYTKFYCCLLMHV